MTETTKFGIVEYPGTKIDHTTTGYLPECIPLTLGRCVILARAKSLYPRGRMLEFFTRGLNRQHVCLNPFFYRTLYADAEWMGGVAGWLAGE